MSSNPSSSPVSSVASVALLGAVSGCLAGAMAGLLDGLWSWTAITQFLPGVPGKLRLLAHLALSYAFAGGLLAALLAIALQGLASFTRWPHIRSQLTAGGPSSTPLTLLSFALVGPPLLGLLTNTALVNAFVLLSHRKHPGLIIASTLLISVVALVLAALALLLGAAAIETLLARWQDRPALRSVWTAGVALVGTFVVTGFAMRPIWLQSFGTQPWKQLWSVPAGMLLLCLLVFPIASVTRSSRWRAGSSHAFCLVVVGLPALAIALAGAYFLSAKSIASPTPVLIAKSVGFTLCSLAAASLATVLLVNALVGYLRRYPWGWLSSPRLPWATAAILFIGGASLVTVHSWKTLSLLALRPLWVAMLMLCSLAVTRRVASAMPIEIGLMRGWRTGVPTALFAFVLLFASLVFTGSQESVRKALVLHSGLGAPLAKVYRGVSDLDRDGYSPWLGGGDCDDWNARVHPNADEIPFDGIDNNCLRGDVSQRSANATRFSKVPQGLPEDFNVILITIDTIRADHLGAYGYARNTTPNIDKLAASGTLFQNGWAHAPSTRYSIPALLTGRYPLNVHYAPIPGQWPGLQEKNLTIAEVLKGQGFTTAAILNYWYFDKHRNMDQGFDHYDNTNKRLHRAVQGKGPAKTSGSSSKEQTDKALQYLASNHDKRFFMWVHYYDPHYDYETHEGVESFGSSKIDAYDHEIAYTDLHIGRLLDDLASRGLDKNTVVVLTGDHGEGFGEHGIDLHGYHLYAAQTKVPFIIRVPGVEPSVIQRPASHVDVLPTLANLAGAASQAVMLGESLVGVFTGAIDSNEERFIFQQLSYENNNEYRGASSSTCHILYNVSPNLSWELYRVDQDPMEERDIIDTPGECAGARAELEAWYDMSEIPEGAVEALLTTKPVVEAPLQVRFADSIQLLQAKMPQQVRRGESFTIEYIWSATDSPPRGWKVFAHFEGVQGGRFSADHKPPRPFSWWKPGQYIGYQNLAKVPANQKLGTYSLWFGLFKGANRLSPQAAGMQIEDKRILLGEIEVVP